MKIDLNTYINGIWRVMPSPALSEIIAQSGFNFQILDCEHGVYDFQSLESDIRACELFNCTPWVRVSGLNKVEVQRSIDLGARGIVFPQLSGYEDFKEASRLVKYAPEGTRGFNPFVRSWQYGVQTEGLPGTPLCITIIETLQAVEQLDRILTLDGIDIIYIGSYDLSAQLECIGKMDDQKLVKVVDEIINKCNKAGKAVGMMVSTAEQFHLNKSRGVNVFVHTVDTYQLKKLFVSEIEKLKS